MSQNTSRAVRDGSVSYVRGEATRCRCLAVCPTDGYALVQSDTDLFSAGCRNNLTRAQALAHWNRTDARAKLFTAAIEGAML